MFKSNFLLTILSPGNSDYAHNIIVIFILIQKKNSIIKQKNMYLNQYRNHSSFIMKLNITVFRLFSLYRHILIQQNIINKCVKAFMDC